MLAHLKGKRTVVHLFIHGVYCFVVLISENFTNIEVLLSQPIGMLLEKNEQEIDVRKQDIR